MKNPNLASALFVAILNAAAEFGLDLTGSQVSSLNIVLVSVLAVVTHKASVSTAGLEAVSEAVDTAVVAAAPVAAGAAKASRVRRTR